MTNKSATPPQAASEANPKAEASKRIDALKAKRRLCNTVTRNEPRVR